MPNSWDEETKKKMSESHKKSWAEGERVHPITKLKVEKADIQRQLDEMKAELEELKRWREEVRAVARKHREIIEKGAQKESSVGEMCKDLLDVLGS